MRIEDGIFTSAHLTVGTDINAGYDIHATTRAATAQDVDAGVIGSDGTPIALGEDLYVNPSQAGVGMKVYTNAVGGDSGAAVTFKLASGSTVTITVYAGMMLPLVTTGCNTPGLLILG